MASYRDAYPSGKASASAAYRYSEDTLRSREASMLGLFSQEEGGFSSNSLGLLSRSSVYGYDSAWHNARDLKGRGLMGLPETLHETRFGRGFLDGAIGSVAVSSGADLYGRMHGSEPTRWKSGSRALDGRTLYSGDHCFSARSAKADACSYSHNPDAYMGSTYHRKQMYRTPPTSLQASSRKRKTPSLDDIIKETWELHSLYRAGLAAASDISESSTDDTIFSDKRGKWSPPTSNMGGTGWTWADTSSQREPYSGWTRQLDSNGLSDTTCSWKELDVSSKERNERGSNNKHKESSHALDLQRSTCERVVEFLGNNSDEDSSDDDCFEDSDDDAPNAIDSSSCDVKSREEQAYEFFLQTFLESKELQKLYSEQCHVGKFECLVCSSIPGKPAKKYNGLISVIMHANKIIKTKKKQEHRGYARALCSALGWDLCRLPVAAGSSSPHPRCCIPTYKEQSRNAKKTDEMTKHESDNCESEKYDNREEDE